MISETVQTAAVSLIWFTAGYLIKALESRRSARGVESQANRVLQDARRDAEARMKEAEVEAKTVVLNARDDFDKAIQARRDEVKELDERIHQKEENLERKVAMIDKKERIMEDKLQRVAEQQAESDARAGELHALHAECCSKLEHAAHMTSQEAKQELLSLLESDVRNEMDALVRARYQEANKTVESKAREIVTTAIQRYVAAHVNDILSSTVPLPSDEMKGRIIGRNGRNIRSLEAVTGATILVDDTPEAVVISAFDPVRREVARQTLDRLITDGRIHPGRIEEVVDEVRAEMDDTVRKAGEDAAFAAGVQGVDPEIIRVLGRLKFRSSYAQNVLDHSVEVSHLIAGMASELGLDPLVARRVGLFHDIGKAVDHEVDGPHAIIGGDLLKRHGESEIVANAVAAHHNEVESQSLYSVLASTADAISSARPGARTETTQAYIKRLEKLEQVANSFRGVASSYAIHAGREIRVLVKPDVLDDNAASLLARDITAKIQADMQYPGQIRVTVIRETRCVEYAK